METTTGKQTLEIKQEPEQQENQLKNFLLELNTMRAVLIEAGSKLGSISSKCVKYFEDYDLSCDLHRMLTDGLKSINTGLDEVEEKFRRKYDLNTERRGDDDDDDDHALCQLLLGHEVTMKSEEDYIKHEASTPTSYQASKSASSPRGDEALEPSDFNSDDEIPNPHVLYYYYESPCEEEVTLGPPPPTESHHNRIRNLVKKRPRRTSRTMTKPEPPSPSKARPHRRPKKISKTTEPQPPTVAIESTLPPKKRGRKPTTLDKSPVSCPICAKILAYNGLPLHTKRCHTVQPLAFTCSLCPRQFTTKGQLTNHAKIHSERKSFVCEICGWGFHLNSNLQQHMRKHRDERPFKCDQCEDTFKFSQSLSLHVQAIHSEKSNQCTLCGKLFGTLTALRSHEACVHLEKRSYACHLCGKKFKRGDHLKYHVKTHANPASKKRGLNRPRV